MNIILYGEQACGKCEAAKQKLDILGLKYDYVNLAEMIVLHDGWRCDGSIEVMAAYAARNQSIPLLQIDGEFYSYSEAMKLLKDLLKRPLAS